MEIPVNLEESMLQSLDPDEQISLERAAEMLEIPMAIVHQRMDVGRLPYREVETRRTVRVRDVVALKKFEDRRRALTAALSADTEDLEENYGLPPFSLENYELQRDPDESDEHYASRRSLFEGGTVKS